MSLNRTISNREWVSLSLRKFICLVIEYQFIWFHISPKQTPPNLVHQIGIIIDPISPFDPFLKTLFYECALTGGVGDLIESPLTSRLTVVKLWPWLKKIGGGHAPNLYDREIIKVVKGIDVSWAASSTMGPSFKWLLH